MKFKVLFTILLTTISVVLFAQDPTVDGLGASGIQRVDAAPTWARTDARQANVCIDVTTETLYLNDDLDATWTALTGVPTGTSGQVIVYDAGGNPVAVNMTGAVVIDNAGVTTIAAAGVNDQANGLDIDVTTSAGAISIAHDFTELTDFAGTIDVAADELILRDDDTGDYVTINLNDIAGQNIITNSLTQTTATTQTLLDNDAAAVTFGSAGATSIMSIVTTDGSEAVNFGNAITVTGTTTLNGDAAIGDAATDAFTVASDAPTFANMQGFNDYAAAEAALGVGVLWWANTTNSIGALAGTVLRTYQ